MGCWYHAKTIVVSDGYVPIEDEDGYGDDFDEGVKVAYLVADHKEGDQIDIDVCGESGVTPERALRVANAIQDVYKWAASRAGQKEIKRLRAKHDERDDADRKAWETKRSTPTGSAAWSEK